MTPLTHDAADLPQASTCDHPADHLLEAMCPRCGTAVDAVCPECGENVERSGVEANGEHGAGPRHVCPRRGACYRRLIQLIHDARNSKFTLDCFLIATGDGFAAGISMTDMARKWSVRKATVSKQCRFICGYLGIPPSRYMRKEELAQKFRLSNRRPHRL